MIKFSLLIASIFVIQIQICFSQSVTNERVAKIKGCTVRITIEGSDEMGTGFFIDSTGSVLTCWHVISSSLIFKNGILTDLRKIHVTQNNGISHEVNVPLEFIREKIANNAQLYDYCLLTPTKSFRTNFMKLGNFKEVNDGDEIYACGYPLGIETQFISKGIFSTKYSDSVIIDNQTKFVEKGLLDITLNKGNSGGAIIRIGKTISEDKVIGIAEFIVNTYSKPYSELKKIVDNAKGSGDVGIMGVSMVEFISLMLQAVNSASNGISGCISIDYFKSNIQGKYSDYK